MLESSIINAISTKAIKAMFSDKYFNPSEGYLCKPYTEQLNSKLYGLVSYKKSTSSEQIQTEVNRLIIRMHYSIQHNIKIIELSGNRELNIDYDEGRIIFTLKKPRAIKFYQASQIIHIAELKKMNLKRL